MRCTRCRLPLLHPAVESGALAWGRHCAKLSGVLVPRARRRAADVLRDERTRDLFEEGWDL